MKKRILFFWVAFSMLAPMAGRAQQFPWYRDIQAFKQSDSLQFPPKHAILFIGSSSFTKWTVVQDAFPGYTIINRAFGGSNLKDQIRYAQDIIYPYDPREVVIYCGDNDLAEGADSKDVAERFETLFGMIRSHEPGARVVFVSIKPSPSRRRLMHLMQQSNQLIKNFLWQQSNVAYVNVFDPMLNENGEPRPEIFLDDSLHMNAKGYVIWQSAIKPFLIPDAAAGKGAVGAGSAQHPSGPNASSRDAGASMAGTGAATGDTAMDDFINRLMSEMTLEEKIGQLNLPSVGFDITGPIVSKDVDQKIRKGLVGGVFNTYTPSAVRKLQDLAVKDTRLHIPLLFGFDVIHGHKTVFPIPLGMSCTWDTVLVEKSARIAGTEASADGLNWVFAPMVDIARDPRWGRIAEGNGEDPYIGSCMARALVRGFQGGGGGGRLDQDNTVMACVKHFALYGAAEAGRDYNTVDMSHIRMYQYYLPPYHAAVEAGAGSVMSSFNEINGIPATANTWLLTDLLRKQWGFKGFVVTDYTAINEMIEHGLGDLQKVSALALNAGVDMDMVGEGFLTTLPASLASGAVSQAQVDDACRLVLEAKYKLGLFKDPYLRCDDARAAREIMTPANKAAAREIAEHSCVLLKNAGDVLPLKRSGTIALIGPLADDHRDMIGCWSGAGDWTKSVSMIEGLKNLAGPAVHIRYAKGANMLEDTHILQQLNANDGHIVMDKRSSEAMITEAVAVARASDVVVAVLGEPFGMSGEAASMSDIGLPACQEKLLRALIATGKPVVLVLVNGRPLTLPWEAEHVPAILETWYGGTEAGNATAAVLFGDYNPSGKLTITFPRDVGQIPIYYNHKNTGRPFDGNNLDKYKSRYLDIPNGPLFCFGYGLSYTHFAYGDLQLDRTTMRPDETLKVTVRVTNTGDRDGEETAQLYIRDMAASLTQPVKALKTYRKVFLKKGESQDLVFTLGIEDLKFYNGGLDWVYEPGKFRVFVGANSEDVKEADFTLVGQ